MKQYIAVTGVLFLLIAAAHALRVMQERHLVRDPWFLLTTLIALFLAGWAFRLIRSAKRESSPK